jgi:uncharacterized membrane protein YqjE
VTVPDPQPTLGDELRNLQSEARAAVTTELAFQAGRARLVGKALGKVALYALLLLAAFFFVLMALAVGAIIALAPTLGGWGATAVVVLALLALAALAGLGAMRGARRIGRLLAAQSDGPADGAGA